MPRGGQRRVSGHPLLQHRRDGEQDRGDQRECAAHSKI
jgi:hypothetical protein